MVTFISFPSETNLGLAITTWIRLIYDAKAYSYVYTGDPIEFKNGKIINSINIYKSPSVCCIEFLKTPKFSFYILDRIIDCCSEKVYIFLEGDELNFISSKNKQGEFALISYPAAIVLELESRKIPYYLIFYPKSNLIENGVKILEFIENKEKIKLGSVKFGTALNDLLKDNRIDLSKLLYF
jgi:hypothetical protein